MVGLPQMEELRMMDAGVRKEEVQWDFGLRQGAVYSTEEQ